VRVRIPLSALSPGTPSGATIEADLLVGEDGLASGIRFSPADTVFVSTAEQ
jgi:2-polyprenyl-6-methoxyphenol hydroxylase-like FAD-dependent oxidoreductase